MKIVTTILAILITLEAHYASGFVRSHAPKANTNLSSRMAMPSTTTTSTEARKPNPVIKVAATGMSLLKPIFKAEAKLQAAILGSSVDDVQAEIEALKKKHKCLVYTYSLSPFSTEALAILDSSGYQYEQVELGAEWFLLGSRGSATRVALGREVEGGATSLPKIFIGGKCIGGCAELSNLVESGEFDSLMKKARVPKRKN